MNASTAARAGSLGLIFTIFAESLLSPAGIHLVSPSLALMAADFADHPWAKTLVPMVITLPGLLIALCAPMMGALGDRIGVRPLLIWSTITYIVVGILPFWLQSLPAIVASRFVFGVAESALAVCGPPLIAAAFVANQRRAMIGGRLAVIGLASVGLALAGGWAAGFGWRSAYLMYGFAIVPLVLILLFVPKLEARAQAPELVGPSPLRSLLPVLGLTTIYGTGIAALFVFVPFLLRDIGHTAPSTASFFSALAAFTTAVASICFPFAERLASRRNLFAVSFGLMALGCLTLAMASGQAMMAAGVFTVAFGMGLYIPTATDLVLDLCPPTGRGKGIGLMMMFMYVGNFLTPFGINALIGGGFKLSQAYLGLMLVYGTFAILAVLMRTLLVAPRPSAPLVRHAEEAAG